MTGGTAWLTEKSLITNKGQAQQLRYNTRFVCKWLERAGQGGGAGACSGQWAMWPDMRGSLLSIGKSMVQNT